MGLETNNKEGNFWNIPWNVNSMKSLHVL